MIFYQPVSQRGRVCGCPVAWLCCPGVRRARGMQKREVEKWDGNERGNSTSETCSGSSAHAAQLGINPLAEREELGSESPPARGSVQTRLEKSGWEADVNRNLRLRLARDILINKFIWTLCLQLERRQNSCCVQEMQCSRRFLRNNLLACGQTLWRCSVCVFVYEFYSFCGRAVAGSPVEGRGGISSFPSSFPASVHCCPCTDPFQNPLKG